MDRIGRLIGTYRIAEKLGEGRLGSVYRVTDEATQREAAIKILRPEYGQNADFKLHFGNEAVALTKLAHPAIAALYAFFPDQGDYILMTELVPGQTLANRLGREGALPWQHAVEATLRTLDGVGYAHEAGVMHGDLKSGNIMVTPDGRVKITDFGVAPILRAVGFTQAAGTVESVAPEVILGKPADGRADLYSMGIVLYQMITGRLPFYGESAEAVLRAHVEEAPKLPSELGVRVPQPVEQALMRALAKNPEYRYADAGAFAAQLREAVAAVPPPPPVVPMAAGPTPVPVAVSAPARAPGSKKGLIAAVIGVVVLIGGGTAGFLKYKDRFLKPAEVKPPVVAQTDPAPTPLPEPLPAPAPAPVVDRDAVLAALEATDGPVPAGFAAGVRPLHYAGVLKASRIAGSGPIVLEAVQRRGVNFHLKPDQSIELHAAGAEDDLIRLLPTVYRAKALPGTVAAAPAPPSSSKPISADPAPPPAPPPSPVSDRSAAPASSPVVSEPPPPPAQASAPALQHLRDIHKIIVQSKQPDLDEDLKAALQAELGSRVEIVRSAAAADAILRIDVADEQSGKVAGAAGRVFGVKGKHKAVAQVVDRRQGRVLWSAEAGDRQAVVGAFGDGAKRLASRIAKQLRKDWDK